MTVDWDWEAKPTYKSERVGIDAVHSPVVLYDMKMPRRLLDEEVALMLSVAEQQLERDLPFIGLVRHERGTGVISGAHRRTFADWLDRNREVLRRDDFAVVIVLPEAIFRAVLRVVYRFQSPPLRTITTSDMPSAADAVRAELARLGLHVAPDLEGFLRSLGA